MSDPAMVNINVLHVGPSTEVVGGMGSVIRTHLSAHDRGRVAALSSWKPGSKRVQLAEVVRCVIELIRARRHYDIVHLHVSQGGSIVRKTIIAAICRMLGYRCVLTVHGSTFPAFAADHPKLIWPLVRLCSVVFVLRSNDRSIIMGCGARNVRVVPNATDVYRHEATAAKQREVIFGGEIGLRKGADIAVSAWIASGAADLGWTLVMAGPVAAELAHRATEWRATAGVDLVGVLDATQLRTRLDAAAIALLPSRAEALPMFLIEAAASGCAIVTTSVGAIPEFFEGAAMVCPPDDPGRVATAITALITEEARRVELGVLARKLAEERFDLPKWQAIFNESYGIALK